MSYLARDVKLQYGGDVLRPGEMALGSIGPEDDHRAKLFFTPTQSGVTRLDVTLTYYDVAGRPQRAVSKRVRLSVSAPPQVHNHYHGPVINGDGVIIMRGGSGGSQRVIRIQSDGDEIEISRRSS
jgi:hypothetical protein